MFFNEYPYRNLTDLNLDLILKQIKDLTVNLEDFVKLNTVKYADPIDWNISKQYEANTVVVNEFTGVAYLSTKPVPSGVDVTNTDYWTPIFTLDFVNLNKNITLRNDGNNNNATFESSIGDWLIVGGQLYKVIQDIGLHTQYVVGYNIQIYSVELFIRDYLNQVLDMIGDLQDLDTADKTSVVNAINEVIGNIGDLGDLNTPDKTSIVNAINSAYAFAPKTPLYFGCVGDGVTNDTLALNAYFKYCSDNGYSCDGLGLTYLIDERDTENTLRLHYGALVRGGRHITNFNFVISPDAARGVCCLMVAFDNKPIIIDNCSFKGAIFPGRQGPEDGGHHAIFINNDSLEDIFPSDWQDYGDIFVDNCVFNDTWSYSVFPTPLNGTLCITNCRFTNARTCAILPYATNVILDNLDFQLATHEHVLLHTMCDMEIERFNNDNVASKLINVDIAHCNSHNAHLYSDAHIGKWAYNRIYIHDNYLCTAMFAHVPGDGGQLTCYHLDLDNNFAAQTQAPLRIMDFTGAITIKNINLYYEWELNMTGSIYFENCRIGSPIFLDDANIGMMKFKNCAFTNVTAATVGLITAIRDTTPVQWGWLIMDNCEIERHEPIFWKTNFAKYFISNCKTLGSYTKIAYEVNNFSADMFIDNLIVDTAYPAYELVTGNFTGNVTVTNSKFTDNYPVTATGKVTLIDIVVNNEKANCNLEAPVNLSGYNAYDNCFIIPEDGYIHTYVNAISGTTATCNISVRGNNDLNPFTIFRQYNIAYTYDALFVKKGMKVYVDGQTADVTCEYIKLTI